MRWSVLVASFTSLFVLAGCDRPSSETSPGPSGASASTAASPPASTGSSSAASAPSASAPAVVPADAIIAQHVLVAYRGARRAPKTITRSKGDAKTRAAEALAKIQAGAAFEDVVKQYSDDPASAERMGSLGKFHRADMDPTFSAAAFALQPGQVSDVVETPFGFHLIKRTQ
jgi:hypothetical protein